MDGTRQSINATSDHLCVVLTDGQQHHYLRTDEFQTLGDGHSATVFRWDVSYRRPT